MRSLAVSTCDQFNPDNFLLPVMYSYSGLLPIQHKCSAIRGGVCKGTPHVKKNVFFRATCTSFSAVIKEYIKCIFLIRARPSPPPHSGNARKKFSLDPSYRGRVYKLKFCLNIHFLDTQVSLAPTHVSWSVCPYTLLRLN